MNRILRVRKRSRRPQAGFTLVELMVSLALFSLAIGGVLSVAVAMVGGFREQRNAVAVESAARMSMNFLVDAVRQASPGVSSGQIWDVATCTSTAVSMTDGGTTASDSLDVIFASGGAFTTSTVAYTNSTTSLTVVDATNFAAGDSIVVSDYTNGHFVKITSVSGNTLTIPVPACTTSAFSYGIGSLVIRAKHATFSIGTVDGVTSLMFDPDSGGSAAAEPLAEGIEDLQFALGVDTTGTSGSLDEVNSAANDDDWINNRASETQAASTAIIRAVRIGLVAQTLQPISGNVNLYSRTALENRTAGSADKYRRRSMRTVVELRNFSGSP